MPDGPDGPGLECPEYLSGPARADELTDPAALDIVIMDMASSGSPERPECHGFILEMKSHAIPEGIGKAPGKARFPFSALYYSRNTLVIVIKNSARWQGLVGLDFDSRNLTSNHQNML